MSNQVTGFVGFVKEHKRDTGSAYSLLVEDVWYSYGFNKPPVTKGDKVQFEYTQNGSYKNIDTGSFKHKTVPEDQKPKTYNKKPFKGGARDGYWENKEKYDKQVVQPLILYQNALNRATDIAKVAVENDVLSLGAKKADRLETLVGIVCELQDQIFIRLNEARTRLEKDGQIFEVEDDEELSSTTTIEDEAQPLPQTQEETTTASDDDDWD